MSDYKFLMESRLSPEQYAVLTLMSRLAAEQGLNLYLVGGAVRDLTYGQQVVRDLDFAVEGPSERMLRALPRPNSSRVSPGANGEAPLVVEFQDDDEYLNSSELVFSSGVRAELAMCRDEVYAQPGERPQVRPAHIFEDLKRRDFAIDAMAVSLHPNSRGLLLDPTNGAGDIERREIRALQSRSFLDDPSRIYRLLRLASRLSFEPDERTQRWLDTALGENAWERLDAHQQARELAAILREDQPDRILRVLTERKLLGGLDKKLASVRLPYDRFARIRNVLQNAPGADPFLLNFHTMVEKMPGDQKSRLAKKIIRDSNVMKLALGIENDARKLEHTLSGPKAELPSQVYNLLSPQPRALLYFALVTTKVAKVQNRIKSFLFKFPEIRSRLPRAELQSLGVKPGQEFDRIIGRIFAMQLDGKIKSHQQLMKEMRDLAGIKEPLPPPPVPQAKRGKEKPAGHTTGDSAKGEKKEADIKKGPAVAARAGTSRRPAPKGGASRALRPTRPSAKPNAAARPAPRRPVSKKARKA